MSEQLKLSSAKIGQPNPSCSQFNAEYSKMGLFILLWKENASDTNNDNFILHHNYCCLTEGMQQLQHETVLLPQTFKPLSNFRSLSLLLLPSQNCLHASSVEKDLICKLFRVTIKLLLKPSLKVGIGNLLQVFLLAQGGWTRCSPEVPSNLNDCDKGLPSLL